MSTVIEKNKNAQAQTAKHTPGPWGRSPANWWTICRPHESQNERCPIADVHSGVYGHTISTAEAEANAKLIAAAPELLEALRDTLEVALNYGIRPNTESSALIRAHNLIKRIDGE